MKYFYALILVFTFLGNESYSQPGGPTCATATLMNLPTNIYHYYSDSGWASQGFNTQSSPAWFKFIVPADTAIHGFIIKGYVMGQCSTVNKILQADIYKSNCTVSNPVLTTKLNYCFNLPDPAYNDLRNYAIVENVSPGDSFYVEISGNTVLGNEVSIKWLERFPNNDTCTRPDSLVYPITYGSNYSPIISSGPDATPVACQNLPNTTSINQGVLNPVFYTIVPNNG